VPPAFSGMTWRSVSGLEGNSTTTRPGPGGPTPTTVDQPRSGRTRAPAPTQRC
jgi:hypothetical protein